jgi:hypothetical protein
VIDVMDMEREKPRSLSPGVIAAGVVLLVLGAGMLLDTTGVADIRMGRLVAPLVLISIGVSTVLSDRVACGDDQRQGQRRGRRRNPSGGFWLIGLGAWMMASQTHVFGLTFGTSWPLLIVLTGIMIMVRGMR